jgi:hypothetical protein
MRKSSYEVKAADGIGGHIDGGTYPAIVGQGTARAPVKSLKVLLPHFT